MGGPHSSNDGLGQGIGGGAAVDRPGPVPLAASRITARGTPPRTARHSPGGGAPPGGRRAPWHTAVRVFFKKGAGAGSCAPHARVGPRTP